MPDDSAAPELDDDGSRRPGGEGPLDEPADEPPLDEPISADDLLEESRGSDELPDQDERLADVDRSESQGRDPIDAELGPDGEGDLLPEDR